jgi:geranylgeranyl diphosphate synthase type I
MLIINSTDTIPLPGGPKGALKEMELREFMTRERELVQTEIASFMKAAIAVSPDDPLVRRALNNLSEFTLREGKRVRPLLMIIGYIACGGKDLARIRKASVSMELVQSMLLIHDDIMDCSDMRRGGPSFHRMFGPAGGPPHDLGSSLAIIGGDLAESLAGSALSSSGFPPGMCLRAIRSQSEMVRDTGYGQMMDVSLSSRDAVSERDIEMLQVHKTAIYTFDGPLRIGAILAGAKKGQLRSLHEYAIPVGVSFQIIDDVLGFFGDPKKGGESDISDLKEGKSTLILMDLLNKCTKEEADLIRSEVGSPHMTIEDAVRIRALARSHGSDAASRDYARKKVEYGIAALDGADLDPTMKGYLVQIAKDLLGRA